jgi:hypothetical protein
VVYPIPPPFLPRSLPFALKAISYAERIFLLRAHVLQQPPRSFARFQPKLNSFLFFFITYVSRC